MTWPGAESAHPVTMAEGALLRRVREERGDGVLAYVVIIAVFGVLVFQPSLIVAAVNRLSILLNLFVSQLGYAF